MYRNGLNIVLLVLIFGTVPIKSAKSQGDTLIVELLCWVDLDSVHQGWNNFDIEIKTLNGGIYSLPPPSDRTEDQNYIVVPDILSANMDGIKRESIDFTLITSGCMTDKIRYTIDSSMSTNNKWVISSFYAESYSVEYPMNICENAEPVAPVTDLSMDNVSYMKPSGLSIDNNGIITPQKSVPGNYTLNLTSQYCLKSNQINVSLQPQPDFIIKDSLGCDRTRLKIEVNNVEDPSIRWSDNKQTMENEVLESQSVWVRVTNGYGCSTTDSMFAEVKKMTFLSAVIDKLEADCWTDGKINLQSAELINNVGDYSYQLVNTVNGVVIDRFEQIPEGQYRLQAVDSRNCVADAPDHITIIQKCLENYPVFTPNSDGVEDQYFIPYEGKVKIFNSESRLVNELESPVYWDGRDNNGNLLPMGNYVMITDQGRPVNITIVR